MRVHLSGMCAASAALPLLRRTRVPRRLQRTGLRDASEAERLLMPHVLCGPRRLRPPGQGPLCLCRSTNRLPSCTRLPSVRQRPWPQPQSPVRRHHPPAASPVPSEQPMRDARVVLSPWPTHIGVPPPAGVPVDSPVPETPWSRDSVSPQRPSSSTRQVLLPYDFGPSSSSHGEAPTSRGSSAASPVVGAAFLSIDDDHALPDDVAVSSPPLDAESFLIFLPGFPVSPASSSSPPAFVDEAAAVTDKRDEVSEQPDSDNATLQMPPVHTRLIED
ncbi:hypothetical protein MRX96_042229 [Rhipicephalus microplus]